MKRTFTVGLVAALALVAAGCGDDSDSTSSDPPDTPAVTGTDDTGGTDGTGGATAVTSPSTPSAEPGADSTTASTPPVAPGSSPSTTPADVPERIVSLSPTHSEILFAIGARDQVVAVDSFSNHPQAALEVRTDLSGLEPNVEAISGYEPDLVIVQDEGPILRQLDRLDIDTWIGSAPRNLGDVYAQIEELGTETGHADEAAELSGQMQADIDELTAEIPTFDEPLTYYHELDSTYFSVTSDTFLGNIYSLLGLRNIADQVEGDSGGYPQLNAEFIVNANPDLIFLADTVCCGETAETVAARDGWGAISAVENGLVIEMNDDIASRWGPRIVDYVREVRLAVDRAASLQPAG